MAGILSDNTLINNMISVLDNAWTLLFMSKKVSHKVPSKIFIDICTLWMIGEEILMVSGRNAFQILNM